MASKGLSLPLPSHRGSGLLFFLRRAFCCRAADETRDLLFVVVPPKPGVFIILLTLGFGVSFFVCAPSRPVA